MKSLSKLDQVNLLISVYVLIELYFSTLVSYSETTKLWVNRAILLPFQLYFGHLSLFFFKKPVNFFFQNNHPTDNKICNKFTKTKLKGQ